MCSEKALQETATMMWLSARVLEDSHCVLPTLTHSPACPACVDANFSVHQISHFSKSYSLVLGSLNVSKYAFTLQVYAHLLEGLALLSRLWNLLLNRRVLDCVSLEKMHSEICILRENSQTFTEESRNTALIKLGPSRCSELQQLCWLGLTGDEVHILWRVWGWGRLWK